MSNFGQALESLADSEQQFANIARAIVDLYNANALRPEDIALYDSARVNLYAQQMVVYGGFMQNIYMRLPSAVAALLPDPPHIAPPLPIRANAPTAMGPTAGLGNLGFAPLVIAGVAIPFWAVAIVVIAAVMVVCYAISVTANTVVALATLDTQLIAVNSCLRASRTAGAQPSSCLQALHPPPPPGGEPDSWIKWFLIATGVTVGGLFAIYMLPKRSESSHSGSGSGRPLYLTAGGR